MLFAQFDEASTAKNYSEAMARFEQIPADSVYKRRAKPRYDEARTLLVAEHMSAADKAHLKRMRELDLIRVKGGAL